MPTGPMPTGPSPTETNPATPAMRMLLTIAGLLVLIIGLPIYLVPTRTDLLFSWTVNPPITAAFLGGAYLGACVIELTSARETSWTRARIAVPAVLLFTTMTLVATLLHFGKFHFAGDLPLLTRAITWVWLVVYASVPVIMAILLLLQVRRATPDPRSPLPMSAATRGLFLLLGLSMLLFGLGLFLAPLATKGLWPWPLSPLTARAIGAWLLGIGFLHVHIAREGDLWRVENALSALTVFVMLQGIALARLALDTGKEGMPVIDWSGPRIWVYVAVMALMLILPARGWSRAGRLAGPH